MCVKGIMVCNTVSILAVICLTTSHASQPVFDVMSRKERLQVPSFKLLVIMDDEFAAFQLQIAFADVGVNHA